MTQADGHSLTKGGVGKSTLTGHLAAEAARHGAGPVAIVDCDPPGSLAEWWNSREADIPLFASSMIDGRIAGEVESRSPAAHEITALWQEIRAHLRTYTKE